MAKRREDTPPPGSPLWLATFGDLMNLLLCFFVLLFAMSSVDEEKFNQIAASFSTTFSVFKAGASAIGDGVLISNGVSQLNELDQYINSMGKASEGESELEEMLSQVQEEQIAKSEQMAEMVQESIDESGMQEQIDVEFNSQYVLLTLNGGLLFDSGKAQLKEESLPIMEKIGKILEKYSESVVEVEGHTDNVPINSAKFANNNELSSGRALAVFDYLQENTSLDPALIKHSGRGEYVPIADNSTPEGRSKNRRVEIKLYHNLSSY